MQRIKNPSSNNIWGMARLFMVARYTLCPPLRGGRQRFSATAGFITGRLKGWLNNEISSLWVEVSSNCMKQDCQKLVVDKADNRKRCMQLVREGHYGKAIRALKSNGIAIPGYAVALQDHLKKHPAARGEVQRYITATAALTVDAAQVKKLSSPSPKDPLQVGLN